MYLPASISNLSKNLRLKAHPAQQRDILYRQYPIESTFWHIVDQSTARAFANTRYASGFGPLTAHRRYRRFATNARNFPRASLAHRYADLRMLYDVTATPLAICEIAGRFAALNETSAESYFIHMSSLDVVPFTRIARRDRYLVNYHFYIIN